MKETHYGSPRLEPQRWHLSFCALMKRQPGELNLMTKAEFRGLVGQFFIVPKRNEFWVKLKPSMLAWHARIEKHTGKRIYAKRRRRSISDDLWTVLARLYWNHAVWIILRGEYKAMKKMKLSDEEIEKRLKQCYGYLAQVRSEGWVKEVKSGGSPSDLAMRDTAIALNLDEASLRILLSPGRLRQSPPASLILANMDSKKLLSRLRRTPPFRRTAKERALIRLIESEAYVC